MKCNICDADLPEPKPNPEVRGSFDPCDKCMEVVEATLASYEDAPHLDKPAASEEDLGGPDPVLEELYPSSYDPFETEN